MTESTLLLESDQQADQDSGLSGTVVNAGAVTVETNSSDQADDLLNHSGSTNGTSVARHEDDKDLTQNDGIGNDSSEIHMPGSNANNDTVSESGVSEASSKRTTTKTDTARTGHRTRTKDTKNDSAAKSDSSMDKNTSSGSDGKQNANDSKTSEQVREEKRRAARERYEEQHRRRIAELLEARRVADELYEKLAAERRRRIEEARLRDEARRRAVQERRAQMLAEQREKLESWLRKMAERESRRSEVRKESSGSKRRSVSQSARNSHSNSRAVSQTNSASVSRGATGGITTPITGLVSASNSVSTGLHTVANDHRMTQSAYGTLPAQKRGPTPLIGARKRPDGPVTQPNMSRSITMSVRELHAASTNSPVTTRSVSTINVAGRASVNRTKPRTPASATTSTPVQLERRSAPRSKSVGPVRPAAPEASNAPRAQAHAPVRSARSRSAERKREATATEGAGDKKVTRNSLMSKSVMGALSTSTTEQKPARTVVPRPVDKQARRTPATASGAGASVSSLAGPPSIITISRQNLIKSTASDSAANNQNKARENAKAAVGQPESNGAESEQVNECASVSASVAVPASDANAVVNAADKQDDTRPDADESSLSAQRLADEERRAKEEAEQKAKEEAEQQKAKEEAERLAKEEAELKAKEEAEQKAREEAEQRAKEEAERRVKEEAERRERIERERVEALRRIEEERARTKERVSAIMQRVKGAGGGANAGGMSPSVSNAGLSSSVSNTSLSTGNDSTPIKTIDSTSVSIIAPSTNGGTSASLSGSTSGLSSGQTPTSSSSHSPAREQDASNTSPNTAETTSNGAPVDYAPTLTPADHANSDTDKNVEVPTTKATLLQKTTPNGFSSGFALGFGDDEEEPDEVDSQVLLDARIATHKTAPLNGPAGTGVSLADELALFDGNQHALHAEDEEIL